MSGIATVRGAPTRIRSVALFTADLPLAEPFEHASSGRIETLNDIVLRLEGEHGCVGYGEVRGNIHYVTGDSVGRVLAITRDVLAPRLLGVDASSPRAVMEVMEKAVAGNASAKALVDAAVHDLYAKSIDVPVHALLGGRLHEAIRSHATLPFASPEETARKTRSYLEQGFRTVKLRVGLKPFARDLERMSAVRDAIAALGTGAEVVVGADANQAWQPKEAIGNVRRLTELGLSFIEQPVAAGDIVGLRDVKHAVEVPVMADEACGTPEDLIRLIREDAADGFHFKLCKAGGIGRLMRMVAIAEAVRRPYMIGQMDEGMLATAAAVHCGLVCRAKSFELWGYQRVATQPYRGLEMRDGFIHVPNRAGFGIQVDEGALGLVQRFEA